MKFLLLSVVCAAGALAAAEKNALPKDLPAYGQTQPVKTPDVKELKLANGMTVWLAPQPGFPKAAFTLVVRGGFAIDPKDRPGLSDLIAAVVTQGTATRSAKQIAEEIATAGGDLSADATPDATFVETSVLSEKTATALTLLADVVRHAAFADHEVSIARENLVSELEANEADPAFLSRRALYRTIFRDHPYSVMSPTKAALRAATPTELRREYARRFRPEHALLVVSGDFTEQSIAPAIHAAFDDWKGAGEAAAVETPKPPASVSRTLVYVPRANSVQTTLLIGTLGPNRRDPDYAAARMAVAIYGGMFGSRLVTNIREDKGYTYSPGARSVLLREAGLLATRADVRNEVTGASFNEISYELNRMATTTPEPLEIESARRYILGSTALSLQSRQSVSHMLANLWVDSLPSNELARQSAAIEKVNAEDVQRVGKKFYPAWRMSVVAVGEEKVIRDELGPFGFEFQRAN